MATHVLNVLAYPEILSSLVDTTWSIAATGLDSYLLFWADDIDVSDADEFEVEVEVDLDSENEEGDSSDDMEVVVEAAVSNSMHFVCKSHIINFWVEFFPRSFFAK